MQSIVTTLQNIVQGISLLTSLANTIRATVSDFTSNTPGGLVTPPSYWNSLGEVTLTDASTVALDLSTGINFYLLATSGVGATRALANPANVKVGQSGYLRYKQSATGSNALTFGTEYVAAGGVATLTESTANNAIDVFKYVVMAGPTVLLTIQTGVAH